MYERVGIGSAVSRIDGRAKVSGEAKYAADYNHETLLYGVVISSAIAKGRVLAIDVSQAKRVPGVVEVITHRNRPHIAWFDKSYQDDVAPPGSPFRPLFDDKIQFSGQPVALVVAATFEAARYAATLIDVRYQSEDFNTDFATAQAERFMPSKKRDAFFPPKNRGDAATAMAKAPVKTTGEYHLATHHHNPMEMHASTVIWHGGGKITVYDKTQGSQNVQRYLAAIFGFKTDDVRVLNPYVGGAFGSGLRPQYQVYLATLAAKMLERSVRVVLTRQQMFTHVHRPEAVQSVSLGAEQDGRLTAISTSATTATSRFENYMETVVNWGLMNYACPNAEGEYAIAPVDTYTPGDMRAPGAATGMTLFEIAIDEMAYACNVDPLDFRLINYSDKDAMNDTPYTSKELRQAYSQAAARFGWDKRSPEPRSMVDGSELVGWGVATGMWEALFQPTTASATLTPDGRLEIACATSDIGTGTYTVMAQVAAGALGMMLDNIDVKLGDSTLPAAPVQGGSWAAASTGAAVDLACSSLAATVLKHAAAIDRSFSTTEASDIIIQGDVVALKSDPKKSVSLKEIFSHAGVSYLKTEETAKAGWGDMLSQMVKSRNAHSAVFAEVKVDEELKVVRVTRIVVAVAAGRIINPKTARSQILGGVVFGIGMALHEETLMDPRLGRFMNHSLAEYHIPAHADVQDIDVIFIAEDDPEVTPLGVKGLGEIGIVGTAAAIANAIYHATGTRVRSLPVTIDKLL